MLTLECRKTFVIGNFCKKYFFISEKFTDFGGILEYKMRLKNTLMGNDMINYSFI